MAGWCTARWGQASTLKLIEQLNVEAEANPGLGQAPIERDELRASSYRNGEVWRVSTTER